MNGKEKARRLLESEGTMVLIEAQEEGRDQLMSIISLSGPAVRLHPQLEAIVNLLSRIVRYHLMKDLGSENWHVCSDSASKLWKRCQISFHELFDL